MKKIVDIDFVPGTWAIKPGDALAHWWVKVGDGLFQTLCHNKIQHIEKFTKPPNVAWRCNLCADAMREIKRKSK